MRWLNMRVSGMNPCSVQSREISRKRFRLMNKEIKTTNYNCDVTLPTRTTQTPLPFHQSHTDTFVLFFIHPLLIFCLPLSLLQADDSLKTRVQTRCDREMRTDDFQKIEQRDLNRVQKSGLLNAGLVNKRGLWSSRGGGKKKKGGGGMLKEDPLSTAMTTTTT